MTRPCRLRSIRALVAAAATVAAALAASGSATAAVSVPPGFSLGVFAAGGPTLSNPDDITRLGDVIYVTYQNNTNPDGTPVGATSTIVGYRPDGTHVGSWSLAGHCDGLTADPGHDRLIATVNEDANSSLYTIRPHAAPARQVRHYTYSPDPARLTGGGTDAISIVNGRILISASNPSPSTPGGSTFTVPAVFIARIQEHGSIASLTPAFSDNAPAIDAVSGQSAVLNLSDPDSNAAVPRTSPRFARDFVLDSQGDSELVFAHHPGTPEQTLTRLMLTSSSGAPQVDDLRWTTSGRGTMFVVDAKQDQIDTISGPFGRGAVLTAIPSDSAALPGDLGTIDLGTGAVNPFATGFGSPKGLLYVPGQRDGHRGGHGQRGSDHGHHHGEQRHGEQHRHRHHG